jgi:membrane associated rhomboid family serine protease
LIPFRDTLDQKGPVTVTVALIVVNFGLYLAGLIPHLNFWQMLVALLGLWLFGAYVERRLGSLAFFAIYVALAASTGFLAGMTDEASGPFAASLFMPVLILGVVHLALAPKSRILVLVPIPFAMTFFEVPTMAMLFGWLALEVLLLAV